MMPRNLHALMDYLTGLLVIASPWLFGFSQYPTPANVTIAFGGLFLLYSIFTRYELGVLHLISFPVHQMLDTLAGILLVASPWIFRFDHIIALPQIILGAFEIGTAVLTSNNPPFQEVHLRGGQRPPRHRHA